MKKYLISFITILIFLLSLSGCFQKPGIDKLEDREFKVVPADENNFKDFVRRLDSGRYSNFYNYNIPITADRSYASVTLETTTYKEKTITEEAHVTVERYSKTNVQVIGIDEGDIVKTDGRYIYFSPESDVRIMYYKYPYWT